MTEYEELAKEIAKTLVLPLDYHERQERLMSIIAGRCWFKVEGINLHISVPSLSLEQVTAVKDASWRPVKEIKEAK